MCPSGYSPSVGTMSKKGVSNSWSSLSATPKPKSVQGESDVDAASPVHQHLLYPALSDHQINKERVLARMIEVEPLIRPSKGGRVF
jgi:hypothetical protein